MSDATTSGPAVACSISSMRPKSFPDFQLTGAGPLVFQLLFTETASNGHHCITEGPEKLNITRLALGDQNFPACEDAGV